MIWLMGVFGGVCVAAAFVATAAAGRASGAARNALADHLAASSARAEAQAAARVARTVTGIDYSFDAAHAAESDVSHRIAQDMRVGVATAQRISTRVQTPRRSAPVVPDVFVKSNPSTNE